MDNLQQSLCNMSNKNPNILTDRNILRASLSDFLPQNKLQQNLLLNAFDSEVVSRLRNTSDVTLSALNLTSLLENDYGISKDAAMWAVETWCYLLGLDSVAMALATVRPANSVQTVPNVSVPTRKEYKIGLGVYRAGIDFPAGDVSVQIMSPPRLCVFYGVGKNPNRISTDNQFKDKVYIRVEEGQYIKLMSYETEANHYFIVKSFD